ncbi:MAG: IS110 family transposase [Gammaproteobacteria bacterium]|nr:IS110 family transposase [Gammaproteobacteria bacterium]
MKKYCIGIDVDKKTIKVCLMLRSSDLSKKVKGSKTFSNDVVGFQSFTDWLIKRIKEDYIQQSYVMEATGVYHEQLAYYLNDQDKSVHIVLPLKSKRYLQSLGFRSKTDKIDAKGLSMMGCEQELDQWHPASPELLKLRSLTRQIERLQNTKTSFLNQLEGVQHAVVMDSLVIKSINKMIKELEGQIAKLEQKVKKMVESDHLLAEKYKLVKPLKGVGLMSFAVVVSETNGFALFKNQRQLVCYAGYDVVENQSGQRSGKTRISKKGNSHIRRILHMSSLSAVRNKVPVFRNLHERLVDRSGIKMKGYVAVQRKLLVVMYSLWKSNTPFDPKFGTSGNHEPKLLCSVDQPTGGAQVKTAESDDSAALDELPCNQLPEVLCSVR